MRMERVNSNQIKCYLNKNDLSSRELNFSEIAYGNPKTQTLFHDMMAKALDEFGFDMQNVPIMIEIVPVSYDSIMLIITRVEDPSDIDDQFIEFQQNQPSAREVRESSRESSSNIRKADSNPQVSKPVFQDLNSYKRSELTDVSFAYMFDSFESVVAAAHELSKYRISQSDLYQEDGKYILLIRNRSTAKDLRLLISGLLSEFGSIYKNNTVSFEYYKEHCDLIIENDAIGQLVRLS